MFWAAWVSGDSIWPRPMKKSDTRLEDRRRKTGGLGSASRLANTGFFAASVHHEQMGDAEGLESMANALRVRFCAVNNRGVDLGSDNFCPTASLSSTPSGMRGLSHDHQAR